MAIAAGTRLGSYEIVAAIGAGGMGQVYKARDTRLDRAVAIKVLSPEWVEHPEMKQRFEREAQTIASLNHPHICVLHDIGHAQDLGVDFLVMEYLQGETLAERLTRGALTLDEALRVAIAIVDALDKAHRQGMVHRDLKPSNVMLVRSGGASAPPIAKLLDFGLAKYMVGPTLSSAGAVSPLPVRENGLKSGATYSPVPALTARGTMLGTLQYMAPEQLEGLEVDGRTDIFAFGALLHEMVTGKRAFEGKSKVLLMSAIAASDPPPLSIAQPATPAALDHVVRMCLAKDPDDRWQTARDLLAELKWIAEEGTDAGLPPATPEREATQGGWLPRALLATAALLAVALAVPALLYVRGLREPVEFRYQIPTSTPSITIDTTAQGALSFAISPDGRSIASRARVSGNPAENPYALYVGRLGSLNFQRLAGTEDASQPFWSPDSRSIAFVAEGKLKKLEATGGPPLVICNAPDFSGGAWSPASGGTILFGSASGLYRVSAEGGKPASITSLEPGETGHFSPRFLPDGRRYLYFVGSAQASTGAVFSGSLDSPEKRRVMAGDSKVVYTAPGYVLFSRENAVYAQPFDAGTLAASGEPVRVADEIMRGRNGRGSFDVSQNGVLVYIYFNNATGASFAGGPSAWEWQLRWVNRTGQELDTAGPPGMYRGVELAPDGKRIAVHRHDDNGGDIWVFEPQGSQKKLTFDASRDNSMPIWSPDGSRIAYASLQKGKWGLYETLANGSGTEKLVFESELPKVATSWSPDGARIVFWVQDPKTGGDLWVLPLDGDRKPLPLVASTANETQGQISPNGRWIAYVSDLTSRNEIYVQPFPAGTGRWQVSHTGGDWPRWRGDGKELFYHAIVTPLALWSANNQQSSPLFVAPVTTGGSTFESGRPREILRVPVFNITHAGGDYHTYAISADGQRILYFQRANTGAAATPVQTGADPSRGLVVAMHWTSSLRK